jgi:hypothetical protein
LTKEALSRICRNPQLPVFPNSFKGKLPMRDLFEDDLVDEKMHAMWIAKSNLTQIAREFGISENRAAHEMNRILNLRARERREKTG